MFDKIITFCNDEKKQFFFSNLHTQPHNLGSQWVPVTHGLPLTVEPREGIEDGNIDSEEKFIKCFYSDYEEIPNPDRIYMIAGRRDVYAIARTICQISPTTSLNSLSLNKHNLAPGSLLCNETGFGIYNIELNTNPQIIKNLGNHNITFRRENDFLLYPTFGKNFEYIDVVDIDKIRKTYLNNPITLKRNGDVIEVDLETFVRSEMNYYTKFPLGDNYYMFCDNRPCDAENADKPNYHGSILFMLNMLSPEFEEPVEEPMFLYGDIIIAHRQDVKKCVNGEYGKSVQNKQDLITKKEIVSGVEKIHNAILKELNSIYPMRMIDSRHGWIYASHVVVDEFKYSFMYSDSQRRGTFRCMHGPSCASHWFKVDVDKKRPHTDDRHYYYNFRLCNARDE